MGGNFRFPDHTQTAIDQTDDDSLPLIVSKGLLKSKFEN